MSYITQIKSGNTTYDIKDVHSVVFASCTTAGATAAKIATIDPTNTKWSLKRGCVVIVKFGYANTAASPTLNVNGSGAKNIMLYGTTNKFPNLANGYFIWNANESVQFTYDGTYWLVNNNLDLTWLLAESSLYHDLWAFLRASGVPTYEYSLDNGTTWISATLPLVLKKLFMCKENVNATPISTQNIEGAPKMMRFTWLNGNLHACQANYIAIGCAYAQYHCNGNIKLESNTNTGSDGLTNPSWTTHVTVNNITSNGAAQYIKLDSMIGGNKGVRLTIWTEDATTTSNHKTFPISTIKLLTTRWGNQGFGSEYQYPYIWDYTAEGNLRITPLESAAGTVTEGSVGVDLGGGGSYWKRIYTRDVLFGTTPISLATHKHSTTIPSKDVKLKFNGTSSSVSGNITMGAVTVGDGTNATNLLTTSTTFTVTPTSATTQKAKATISSGSNGDVTVVTGTSVVNPNHTHSVSATSTTKVDAYTTLNTTKLSASSSIPNVSISSGDTGDVTVVTGTSVVNPSHTHSVPATGTTKVEAYTTLNTASQTVGTAASWSTTQTLVENTSDDYILSFNWTANTPSSVQTTVVTGGSKSEVAAQSHTHTASATTTSAASLSTTKISATATAPTITIASGSTGDVTVGSGTGTTTEVASQSHTHTASATTTTASTLSTTKLSTTLSLGTTGDIDVPTDACKTISITPSGGLETAIKTLGEITIGTSTFSGSVTPSGTISADGTTTTFTCGDSGAVSSGTPTN